MDGLRARGVSLKANSIVPIQSEQYRAKAERPRNSRLDTTRLKEVFGITLPAWDEALGVELDAEVQHFE
jgi:dTDP-4-dehydrorhamnose reductase